MKTKNNYIYIGSIINTFGIRGELKIYSESDFIEERYAKDKIVYFKLGQNMEKHIVSSFRIHKNNVLITIDHLDNINLVEKYVGAQVYASAEDEITLEEDDYYIDDLIDLEVYNTKDEYLGVITDVLEMPSGYLLEVKNENKKVLIPFVDAYVKEIKEDQIIIEEIEGLR